MVFFAAVRRLEPLPESEIGEVRLFSALPENLTYPNVTPRLMAEAERNIGGCNMTTEELRNSLLASPKNGSLTPSGMKWKAMLSATWRS